MNGAKLLPPFQKNKLAMLCTLTIEEVKQISTKTCTALIT
jgi:hypothetical protein